MLQLIWERILLVVTVGSLVFSGAYVFLLSGVMLLGEVPLLKPALPYVLGNIVLTIVVGFERRRIYRRHMHEHCVRIENPKRS